MGELERRYQEAQQVRHDAVLRRIGEAEKRIARRRREASLRAFRRMIAALAIVVAAAIGWGLIIGPIGQLGFLAAVVALVIAWVVIVASARLPEVTSEALAQSELPLLPQRTGAWLEGQRAALPAPAVQLVDGIGLKLEALAPQLQAIDPREPAAAEVRKLLAEELPELIQGYTRVPQGLRKQEVNGVVPDRQLVEALGVIDQELDRMSADLAGGDLRKLATQGRYLELKYKEDGGV